MDRRDARKLAKLFKAGLLTVVHPPNEREEALRDLMRAREDAKKDLKRSVHISAGVSPPFPQEALGEPQTPVLQARRLALQEKSRDPDM